MSTDLVLPRAHALFANNKAPGGVQSAPPRDGRGGARGRILLAGADEAQGLMIRRMLEADGYEVLSRASGRDTVLALLAEPADLLLVNAPLVDGSAAALLRWTRARRAAATTTSGWRESAASMGPAGKFSPSTRIQSAVRPAKKRFRSSSR